MALDAAIGLDFARRDGNHFGFRSLFEEDSPKQTTHVAFSLARR